MLTSGYWISALLLAAVAVCWAYVLVQPGMLLAPVQAAFRDWHKRQWVAKMWRAVAEDLGPHGPPRETLYQELEADYYLPQWELDGRWWWKPLWGCYVCVAGQAGFWGYLLLGGPYYALAWANPGFGTFFAALLSHLGYTSATILIATALRGVYAWSQNQ